MLDFVNGFDVNPELLKALLLVALVLFGLGFTAFAARKKPIVCVLFSALGIGLYSGFLFYLHFHFGAAPSVILFWNVAFALIFSSLSVVMMENPLHSALFLVTAMLLTAVLFLMMHAVFLAVLQVIVYAGAVVVLFLFVIMLLQLDKFQEKFSIFYTGLASFLSLGFLAGLFLTSSKNEMHHAASSIPSDMVASDMGLMKLSEKLFQEYLYPFELISVLLLVAMIGVVVMARHWQSEKEDPND